MTSAAPGGKPGFFESALTKLVLRSTTVFIVVALTLSAAPPYPAFFAIFVISAE
jgi:hypothetical protein